MTENQTFDTVFDAITDTHEQSSKLQARSALMRQIADIIQVNA
ncbi:MAG: hypothetical protein ACU84H_02315 [Gammaproteobacteria bacterium]